MTTPRLAERLAAAQARAALLFAAIDEEQLVRPGRSEEAISDAIAILARERFGVEKHWHRRVVRSGPHTRLPFRELPPDRTVESDDIVSLDLGPVFGAVEADFGRTYVLGSDPEKLRLQRDLAAIFDDGRRFYLARPTMTGRELYDHVVEASADRGWGFGGSHAGHLVGSFPLSRAERDAAENRIRPDNERPMNAPSADGQARHWILEVHLLDPGGTFGGFYEQLLA
jgi:Xaa-Pro aminopeptidase